MTIYHKHHIVPRHMGGTDEPSNLTELTIEEHAEAHRILYETYGKHEDYLAWQGLLGLIPKQDIVLEIQRSNHRNTMQILMEKYGVTSPSQLPHVREQISERNRQRYIDGFRPLPDWTGKKHREETKRKIGEKNAISQRGSGNSQYGTMWITNGSENKKIKSIDIIPETWYKGRVSNASVAQLVEHRFEEPSVGGSIPSGGTN